MEEHFEDTLRAGGYHNDKEATRILVDEAPQNIENLLNLGVNFDKNENGELVRTLEGGHRSRRILHAGGDDTGAHVMRDLRKTLEGRTNISVFEDEMAIEILENTNKALGVIVINKNNEEVYVLANKIVIATGGIGGIYKNTTNDKIACGDGIALCKRANVKIEDMEFDGLVASVSTGKVDMVVAGMTATDEKKQSVDFSDPYYVASQVIVVAPDNTDITSAEDLKNDKTVGVVLTQATIS